MSISVSYTHLYGAFYGFAAVGSPEFYRALFIGTIMTATSVSITVATLQELGHLKSFLGTTIVSAAVIDDVIGIVVLTCVLGASSGTGTGLGKVLFNTLLFFATALGVGLVVHYAMKWLDQRNPHTQRITIVSMAFCFAMAYIAEAVSYTHLDVYKRQAVLLEEPPQAARPRAAAETPAAFRKLRRVIIFFIISSPSY